MAAFVYHVNRDTMYVILSMTYHLSWQNIDRDLPFDVHGDPNKSGAMQYIHLVNFSNFDRKHTKLCYLYIFKFDGSTVMLYSIRNAICVNSGWKITVIKTYKFDRIVYS